MPRKRKEPLSGSDDENDQGGPRKNSKNAHPFQRHAANERERSRMRVLSKAFSKLKTTLPWVPSDTKLSKLDTLRLASSYIAHLKQILDSDEEEVTSSNDPSTIHPLNLVGWYRTLVKSAYQKFNFLISQPKHRLWVPKRTVSMRRFF